MIQFGVLFGQLLQIQRCVICGCYPVSRSAPHLAVFRYEEIELLAAPKPSGRVTLNAMKSRA